MFLNDKKGSFGCFSEAGKRAFRIYKNLCFDSLKKKGKTYNIIDNLFGKDSRELSEKFRKERELEEQTDIFKLDDYELKKLKELTTKAKNRKLQRNQFLTRCQSAKQYNKTRLNLINENKRKKSKNEVIVSCTKYNPKYDVILKRSPSCPLWSKLTSRPNYIKEDNYPFYINPKNILENTAGKTFIDMSKQTKRKIIDDENQKLIRPKSSINLSKKSFSNIINIKNKSRPQTGKQRSIVDKNLILNNQKEDKKLNLKKQKSMTPKNRINIKYSKNNISTESMEDSYEEYKNVYIKQIKRNSKSIEEETNEKIKKKKLKAPDFDQFISREDFEKLNDKTSVIPFSLPNYKYVRPKPIMMLIYDRKKHKINKIKSSSLKKMDNSYYFDPYKTLDKYNNHKVIHAPNFNLMTSRPKDDNPLPVYMKHIYSKASCYNITALSLKMNNYSNSNFSKVYSSFFPKKSFNQLINLNLLNSQKFLENIIGNKDKFIQKHSHIGKVMKFYNKNYDDLLKDELISRFDNVTYKTIERNKSVDVREMEKYLLKSIEE